MRRLLAVAAAATLLTGFGVGAARAEPAGPPGRDAAVARAEQVLEGNRAAFNGGADDRYSVFRAIVDKDGSSHVRYDRTYKGLPVLGGDFVIHTGPAGAFTGVSSGLAAPLNLDTRPTLAADAAVAAARGAFKGTVASTRTPRLVVDATHGAPRLAWEAIIEGTAPDGQTPSKLHVLVDARTGTVVGSHDEIQHATGTGNTVYSGTVAIDTTPVGSDYELEDPVRGNGYTCDMNNGRTTCATMTDDDNVWGNHLAGNRQSAAADAHYGAAVTYDYYRSAFGRRGIFGDGRGVASRVHYGDNLRNAFWDGQQMTYGDGENNARPVVSLDVVGHEMTHGVTEHIVNGGLDYSGESGGLNEATSDIFGTMVEFYANNAADRGDYEIGEKVDLHGNGTPLRYMYNPGLDGQSHNCWSSRTKEVDVHYSSGIANHLFFLVAEGSGQTPYGVSPTCNGTGVTGIGRDKAQRIWYRAVEAHFTHTTKYVDPDTPSNNARAYTLKAAADLYGACGIEYRTVERAWSAVNVFAAADPFVCGNNWYTWDYNPNYPIPDPGTTLRPITVDRNGTAPASLKVAVNIKHPFRGQLTLHVVAPDGTSYLLKSANASDSVDDVLAMYTVNASGEPARGTWRLRVNDAVAGSAGAVDGWSLLF